MKVRDLIKQLLDFEMDDDVVVEIESDMSNPNHQRSDITKVTNDGYCVRIVPIGYLVDRDSEEWEVTKA